MECSENKSDVEFGGLNSSRAKIILNCVETVYLSGVNVQEK